MNLWFRLIRILLRILIKRPQVSPLESRTISFYVSWIDCDINKHLTNSRYLSFMDLGRLDFFCAAHLWRRNRAQSLYAILQSVEISFIRSIFPGDSIKLCTSIVGIDEKYCYIEQTFYIHNQLMAHARVRSILYDGHGKRVTINTLALFQKFPSLPGSITQWKNYLSQKTLESPTIHPHF